MKWNTFSYVQQITVSSDIAKGVAVETIVSQVLVSVPADTNTKW